MEVGSSLILSSAEIAALGSTVDEVLESLTLPNPEYQNKIRFGRNKKFYSTIPKTLCYVSREGSDYVLPRYYFGELGKYGNEGRNIDVITNRPFGMKTRNILRKVPEYSLRANVVAARQ